MDAQQEYTIAREVQHEYIAWEAQQEYIIAWEDMELNFEV
jgi:hypothetical protein